MIKFMKKYLEKRGYKVVNEKEFDNISKYRSSRNELKEVTDAYNNLVAFCAENLSSKDLIALLDEKKIGVKAGTKKEDIVDIFKDNFYIEFKKGR